MTLVLDRTTTAPQTHVLIIGVGSYLALPLPILPGLRSLTSPPLSAKNLGEWFVSDFTNPEAPLGSVEVLASPPTSIEVPGGVAVGVAEATMRNVQDAFDAWYKRADTHRGNLAILYFAGHGVARQSLALLTSDFGVNPGRLFENAFDFEMTHRGMACCRAKAHIFIADACRQVPLEILDQLAFSPRPLRDPKLMGTGPPDAPRIYATGHDETAWGRENAVTVFAQAFLEVLRGAGGDRSGGRWLVSTGRLAPAINRVLHRLNREEGLPLQTCMISECSGITLINELPGPPMVPVSVTCSPPAATAQAHFAVAQRGDVLFERGPTPGTWNVSLTAGIYDLSAQFDGDFQASQEELWARPPEENVTLEVGP